MTATVPGPQAPVTDRRHWLAPALGVVQLVLVVPMLVPIAKITMMAAMFGLAGMLPALLFVPLVAAGPLLGLGLATLVARVQGFRKDIGFAVRSFGLLVGTAIEYHWLG
ncbi:hypothetical protein ACGF12_37225 [Kitasatospora sp. NPDC048296]|uniref:hypothetical protein n=1 Tax=Kitasatospora sp. NPDC048296 TaxID=3364048 RepID=UPI00371080D8